MRRRDTMTHISTGGTWKQVLVDLSVQYLHWGYRDQSSCWLIAWTAIWGHTLNPIVTSLSRCFDRHAVLIEDILYSPWWKHQWDTDTLCKPVNARSNKVIKNITIIQQYTYFRICSYVFLCVHVCSYVFAVPVLLMYSFLRVEFFKVIGSLPNQVYIGSSKFYRRRVLVYGTDSLFKLPYWESTDDHTIFIKSPTKCN